MRLPKVMTDGFLMDRKKDGKGNLSVDTRRVTTENAPFSIFCETQKALPEAFQFRPLNRAGLFLF
jgi:hypothetical protein